MSLQDKFAKIRAVVLDIDGVLTDGRFGYYGQKPGDEIKFFHARDGHGIRMALRAGIQVGLLSGRSAAANRFRAEELGLSFYYEDCHDKKSAFLQMLADRGLDAEECCYIGDDIVDIPPLKLAGLAVTVADGMPELDEYVDLRTTCAGGHGAVRELLDRLLREQGKYEETTRRYFGE